MGVDKVERERQMIKRSCPQTNLVYEKSNGVRVEFRGTQRDGLYVERKKLGGRWDLMVLTFQDLSVK